MIPLPRSVDALPTPSKLKSALSMDIAMRKKKTSKMLSKLINFMRSRETQRLLIFSSTGLLQDSASTHLSKVTVKR
ncbi:hypothetical protein CHS0354_002326, partial [Potamilus streckersoni]